MVRQDDDSSSCSVGPAAPAALFRIYGGVAGRWCCSSGPLCGCWFRVGVFPWPFVVAPKHQGESASAPSGVRLAQGVSSIWDLAVGRKRGSFFCKPVLHHFVSSPARLRISLLRTAKPHVEPPTIKISKEPRPTFVPRHFIILFDFGSVFGSWEQRNH